MYLIFYASNKLQPFNSSSLPSPLALLFNFSISALLRDWVATITSMSETATASTYDRKAEAKAFDETKAGVKGLLDSGIKKIPRMFYYENLNLADKSAKGDSKFHIPIIDLKDLHTNSVLHTEIVDQIRSASQKWGFFQVINHGIPTDVLDEMINGNRRFHEQDTEVKKQFYTRDLKNKVVYLSNVHLYLDVPANWRDTLGCRIAPNPSKPEELPAVCRYVLILALVVIPAHMNVRHKG